MVKNVIILFSLLFYIAGSYVCTCSIPLGCVLEVDRVKSVTNAKEGRGLVIGIFFQQTTLTLLQSLFMNVTQNFCNLVPFSLRTCF